MKKFLALSCLISFCLAAQHDSVSSSLRTATVQLKECFEAGNQPKQDCFTTWKSLTNSIFAQQIQDCKNWSNAAEVQHANCDFVQAVERWYEQFKARINPANKNYANQDRRTNLIQARQEFYRGLDLALHERKLALEKIYNNQKQSQVQSDADYARQLQCQELARAGKHDDAPSAPVWPSCQQPHQPEREVIVVEVEKPVYPFLAWLFGRK